MVGWLGRNGLLWFYTSGCYVVSSTGFIGGGDWAVCNESGF